MKILILQLARLGDIYLTWPMIKGLREKFPEATIDIMVRPRFAAACAGLNTFISNIIELPMANIFKPLFDLDNLNSINDSTNQLEDFLNLQAKNNYDWIINSTFSPVSSYLTHYLAQPHTKISGYTRYSDGYLSLPDDISAYFYAQVGIQKFNRIHLSELFCLLADITPNNHLWNFRDLEIENFKLPFEEYIVIHIGASQRAKTFPSYKWRATLTNYFKTESTPVVLIGSGEELKDSDFISYGFTETQVLNLTNKTSLSQLFSILKNSKLLIGCDSAPIHIATLMNTPTLNISFDSVNFWETGPKAEKSRVLYGSSEVEIPSETVSQLITNFLSHGDFHATVLNDQLLLEKVHSHDYSWKLIEFIYMNKEFPILLDSKINLALEQIFETNEIMLHQLESMLKFNDVERFKGIYNQADQIIETIVLLAPELLPILNWYQTEKIKIGPENQKTIFNKTQKIHLTLKDYITILMKKGAELNEQSVG